MTTFINLIPVPGDSETFEATVGPVGQEYITLDAANAAFQATGLPKARFFLAGTVSIGADITIAQSAEFIGYDDSPALFLDFDINTGLAASTLASVYKFQNLRIRVVSGKRINVKDAGLRFEFDGCNLENTAIATGPMLSMTVAGQITVVCKQCVLTDEVGAGKGLFQNEDAGTFNLFLEGCTEAGGSTGAYLYRDTGPGTEIVNLYFLNGTQVRDHVVSGTGTANIHQDGSSTFNLSNNTITTTNLRRMGAATFYGSYTGDGTTFLSISGWDFDTRYVMIWSRRTSSSGSIFAINSTREIVDDNLNGGAYLFTGATFATHSIINLGFGFFAVDDNGTNRQPNTSGTVYNFMVSS